MTLISESLTKNITEEYYCLTIKIGTTIPFGWLIMIYYIELIG